MKTKIKSVQKGFTLIEIMVVVVIIGTLTALIAPNFIGQVDKSNQIAAKAQAERIASQIQLYRLDRFAYPSTSEGLKALLTADSTGQAAFKEIPLDPWKREFQYLQPGQKNPGSFDIWSFGADGAAGGEGIDKDIGNWKD